MKKYSVTISYREVGYVEVEAENEEQAEEKAYEALDDGTVEMGNQFDEPDYEFEIEEIEDEQNKSTR